MGQRAKRDLTPREQLRNRIGHLSALYGPDDERTHAARTALVTATLGEQIRSAVPHLPPEDRRRLADLLVGAGSARVDGEMSESL